MKHAIEEPGGAKDRVEALVKLPLGLLLQAIVGEA